jgi:hypothetical protein
MANSNDPEIITPPHSGDVTKAGATVEVCNYRLEYTKWTLEVVV